MALSALIRQLGNLFEPWDGKTVSPYGNAEVAEVFEAVEIEPWEGPFLNDRARPTIPQMADVFRTEVLPHYGRGAHPEFHGYDDIPIDQVWDYGPIGMHGTAWLHPEFGFAAAIIEGETDPVYFVPGISRRQFDSVHRAVNTGTLFPKGWTIAGSLMESRRLIAKRDSDTHRVILTALLEGPGMDPCLTVRISSLSKGGVDDLNQVC